MDWLRLMGFMFINGAKAWRMRNYDETERFMGFLYPVIIVAGLAYWLFA